MPAAFCGPGTFARPAWASRNSVACIPTGNATPCDDYSARSAANPPTRTTKASSGSSARPTDHGPAVRRPASPPSADAARGPPVECAHTCATTLWPSAYATPRSPEFSASSTPPSRHGPVRVRAARLPYDDPSVRMLQARQLIRNLLDCTVVDLEQELGLR